MKALRLSTAGHEIEDAVVMGIGMALPINSSLADYIVAVNADVPKLEVHFLDSRQSD
jgi:xanthine dehydrogenase YagR molybdenum-binding subunit